MRSRQPKVLHPLCGRPLIAYPLRTARALADRIVLVVGPNAADVVTLDDEWAMNPERWEPGRVNPPVMPGPGRTP